MTRFLIVNADYPGFLDVLYSQHPGLETATYDEHMRVHTASLFGVADFYPRNLAQLGHPASRSISIIASCKRRGLASTA